MAEWIGKMGSCSGPQRDCGRRSTRFVPHMIRISAAPLLPVRPGPQKGSPTPFWQAFRHVGWKYDLRLVRDVDCDAVVSPANSFGFMNGDIEMLHFQHFGWQVQERLQKLIREKHHGEHTADNSGKFSNFEFTDHGVL